MKLWDMAMKGVMTYWYWHVGKLTALTPYKDVEGRRFDVFPGVYKPLENEQACADYLNDGDTVLDLGCGCGVGAIFAAEKAKSVLATDISEIAIRNTKANCEKFGVTNVELRLSDMFENVDGKFDMILANPPYIAADFEKDEEQFATSVRYLPVLFSEVGKHMKENARMVVQFPKRHHRKLEKLAAEHGFKLISYERMPRKSLGLMLQSLAYMQVGFQSTFYLFEPKVKVKAAAEPAQKTAARKAA